MATVLDTHRIVKRLRDAGFAEAQAETVTDVLREAQDASRSELATKADVQAVRTEMAALRAELVSKVELLEQRMTVRLGGIVIAAVAALGAFLRLFPGTVP